MTAAGVQRSPPGAAQAPVAGQTLAGVRLVWLHLVSRRAPAAVGLLAAIGCLLWAALRWRWSIAGGAASREFVPLVMQTGAAAVVAVASYGPFRDLERPTGRWLPWLRLGTVLLLAGMAFAALAAGATGGYLPGGSLALLRNLSGITGTGLLAAAALGGAFGWVGPMAYLLVTEVALTGHPATPWLWPARPPGDLGGAVCAALVLAIGAALLTVCGTRESARD